MTAPGGVILYPSHSVEFGEKAGVGIGSPVATMVISTRRTTANGESSGP